MKKVFRLRIIMILIICLEVFAGAIFFWNKETPKGADDLLEIQKLVGMTVDQMISTLGEYDMMVEEMGIDEYYQIYTYYNYTYYGESGILRLCALKSQNAISYLVWETSLSENQKKEFYTSVDQMLEDYNTFFAGKVDSEDYNSKYDFDYYYYNDDESEWQGGVSGELLVKDFCWDDEEPRALIYAELYNSLF